MDLDEYIWRKKITSKDIAKKIDTTPMSIKNIKYREHSPGLFTALKLFYESNGEIPLEKILSKKHEEQYKLWKEKRDLEKSNK